MNTTTYTGQSGTIHPHISITALTEADIDLMESIESALCRWVRTTPIHPRIEEEVCITVNDALLLMGEFGPAALVNAATPTTATAAEASTWDTIRTLATRQERLAIARRMHRPAPQLDEREATQLANHHTNQAHKALAAADYALALSWLYAAERIDPRMALERIDAPNHPQRQQIVIDVAALAGVVLVPLLRGVPLVTS